MKKKQETVRRPSHEPLDEDNIGTNSIDLVDNNDHDEDANHNPRSCDAPRAVAGRPKNALYPFPEEHALFATHIQRLNSLHPLLIAAGPRPPIWPGPMPIPTPLSWKKRAHAFASYYLVLMRPWNIDTESPGRLSWREFSDFMIRLNDSKAIIDRYHLTIILNFVHGMRMMEGHSRILGLYRGRNKTLWTDLKRPEIPLKRLIKNAFNTTGIPDPDSTELIDDISALSDPIAPYDAVQAASKALSRLQQIADDGSEYSEFENLQKKHKKKMFLEMLESLFPFISIRRTEELSRIEFVNKDLTAQSLFTALKNAPPLSGHNAVDDDEDGRDSEKEPIAASSVGVNSIAEIVQTVMESTITKITSAQQTIIDENVKNIISPLNDGQQKFIKYCITLLNPLLLHIRSGSKETAPEMPGILLMGEPGAGKTYAITILNKVCIAMGLRGVLCAAPVGTAASLLPNGNTIHSLMALNMNAVTSETAAKMNPQALLKLDNSLKDIFIFIIDELSLTKPDLIAVCDIRMRLAVRGTCFADRPFGGRLLILCGDPWQKKPPHGVTIISALLASEKILKNSLSPLELQGVKLVKTLKLFELSQQMRADTTDSAESIAHINFIKRVRNFPLPGSPEANQSGPAEITQIDLNRIAILTPAEALLERWTEAPVVCMNNNDRCQINLHRACVAAKKLGCPVTAWIPSITLKYENSKSTEATPLSKKEMEDMMDADSHLLIQIFFPGQKVIVKRNINTSRKITNGAIAYDYCLDMPDSFTASQKDAFQQEYNSTAPGEICWLPIPPEYRKVTMFVDNINDKTWPEISILNGRGDVSDSIVSGQIIVPIPATKVYNGINLTRPPRPGFSKNVIVSQHSVQPAQAYTDFNIQGSTSKAIIL
nr:AAA family ATPase [Nitrosomonadaceae bacterium]